jgi:hypothetical protein
MVGSFSETRIAIDGKIRDKERRRRRHLFETKLN